MQNRDVDELRPKHRGSIYESGSNNSKNCTIPEEYAEFAGIEGDGYIIMRPYCGPHGNYLVIHRDGKQPEGGEIDGVYVSRNELKKTNGDDVSRP